MRTNTSATYFKLASDCAEVAEATSLENVKKKQTDSAAAWRILGDRALSAETEAAARSHKE